METCKPRILTSPGRLQPYVRIEAIIKNGKPDITYAVESKTFKNFLLKINLYHYPLNSSEYQIRELARVIVCCTRREGLLTTILESSIIAIIGATLTIPPISESLKILSSLIGLLTISVIYLGFYRNLKFKRCKEKILLKKTIPIATHQESIITEILKAIINLAQSCKLSKCRSKIYIKGIKYNATIRKRRATRITLTQPNNTVYRETSKKGP